MKYVLFLAVIMSAFYIGATQLLMVGIQDLANVYENADTIAQNAVYDK